jgi:signal transduction histidine kinase
LRSAGRLAAEFAHQIKNPLAIINNAAFSLQRSLRDGKGPAAQQIEIIQEEVARADKVITQIMGYAQLSEGRVEKLNVIEELDRAIAQVFPPPCRPGLKSTANSGAFSAAADAARPFVGNPREPPAKRPRGARRAGQYFCRRHCHRDYSIEISVRDDGPGIPPDKIERIFEAYYTTKEKGTGLGLAIVKHNAELYGGTVRVESKSLDKARNLR